MVKTYIYIYIVEVMLVIGLLISVKNKARTSWFWFYFNYQNSVLELLDSSVEKWPMRWLRSLPQSYLHLVYGTVAIKIHSKYPDWNHGSCPWFSSDTPPPSLLFLQCLNGKMCSILCTQPTFPEVHYMKYNAMPPNQNWSDDSQECI